MLFYKTPIKQPLKVFLALIVFLLLYSFTSFAGQFKVVKVYDGDTIKAVGHDIEIKVRLVGIDAPETAKKKRGEGQPYSQEAKKYLARLVLNKIVEIKGYGLGRYNRVLGVVYVDDMNVNLEMVKAGYAEVYKGKTPRDFNMINYFKAENEAKINNIGIWSLGNKYVSPKKWRKEYIRKTKTR